MANPLGLGYSNNPAMLPVTNTGTFDTGKEFILTLPRNQRLGALLAYGKSRHDAETDDVAGQVIQHDLSADYRDMMAKRARMGELAGQMNATPPQMQDYGQSTAGESIAGFLGGLGSAGFAGSAQQQVAISQARGAREYQDATSAYGAKQDQLKTQYGLAAQDYKDAQNQYEIRDERQYNEAQNQIKETQKRKDSLQATADDLLSAMAVAKDPESLKLLAGRYNEIAQELGKADADITGLSESIKRRDTEAKANRDVDNYRQAFSTFTVYGGASPEQIAAMEAERQRIKETYGIEVPPVSDQRTVGERKMENAPIEARRKQRETLLQRLRGALAKMQTFEQGSSRYISAAAEANALKAQIDALDNSPDETGGEVAPMNPLQGPIGIRPEGGNPYGSNMAPTKTGRKSSGGGGSKGGGGSGGGYSGLSSKQVAQKRNYYIAAKAKADAADLEIASILAKGMGANADDLKRLTAARNSKRQAESRLKELNTEMKARKPQPKKQPSKPSGKSGKTDGYSWKVVG